MEFERIVLEKSGYLAKISLNRPEILNPIDRQTLLDLDRAADSIEKDPEVRVVVITGRGRGFSAGADLKALATVTTDPGAFLEFLRLWHRVANRLEDLPKPTIAAVNGYAAAGGLEFILVCDLAIAADTAQIGDAHANYGLIPGGGGSQRLPRLIGARRAKELLYGGHFVPAAEAERLGIVNKVVPAAELDQAVLAMADQLAGKSPVGLKAMKYLVNRGLETDLKTGLELELLTIFQHQFTEDLKEGLSAFGEKRRPVFKGR